MDGADDDPNTWEDNDYRLAAGSPCVDVGSNAGVPPDVLYDLDGYRRVTDGDGDSVAVVDMGAFERPAIVRGDLNCDGVVDVYDIDAFVCRLCHPERYLVEYAGCIAENGDVNGDGVVDFADINPFVDLIVGGQR